MDTAASVLEEILTWQQAPCEELRVGFLGKTGNDTKRIMLYGVTQVGKTTLLMNMMGVLPHKQEQLSKILRGGARTGNSATSTAIIYNKWEKEEFGLAVTGLEEDMPETPQLLSERDFAAQVKELNRKNRSALSGSAEGYKDIFHYFIPSHYFETETEEGETVQYIDLPGFGEKNGAMRMRADELIAKCASRVDGAIVVLKANNIIQIQQDYAEFLTQIPQKRLTFVVTHAVKECVEVKKVAEKISSVKAEEEMTLWQEIAGIHRSLIEPEAVGLDDIAVFPVELDAYLEEFYPQLRGVFRHSRYFLQERIREIPAKTTFSACEEMLDLQIELALKRAQTLEQKITLLQEQLKATLAKEQELKEKKRELSELLSPLNKKIAELQKLMRQFSDAITRLDGSDILSSWYVKNSLVDMLLMNSNEKNKYLTDFMVENLEEWLPAKNGDREYKELRDRLITVATKKIYTVDTDDLLKKRDGWGPFKRFGDYSMSHLTSEMAEVVKAMKTQMRKELKSWEKKNLTKPMEEKEKLTQTQAKLVLTIQEIEAFIRQQKEQINELERKCRENHQQITLFEKNKGSIRSVFVKHFYRKKAELEQRIAAEKKPSVKAALLLVLGTIYRNMKHHIEEEECHP